MSSGDLRGKLDRFSGLIAAHSPRPKAAEYPERYGRFARALGGEIVANHAGLYCLVTHRYPEGHRHGGASLPDGPERAPFPRSAFTAHDTSGEISISSLLFLDTETTGLGGSGAIAFLVGCGSFTGDSFEIRQYLIPDYGDETAMLEALLEELRPDRTIVTYNGAAFDLPLLRARMIVNRVARDIEMADHVDLLHSARRLFSRRLSDCTLINVERELLTFHRQDDIPGYLIPSVYFDWLAEDRVDDLAPVLEHNRLDIVSLYFLADHVARAFQSKGASLEAVDDLHSLARVYGRRKDNNTVNALFGRITEVAHEALREDVLFFHSMALKRAGDLTQAVRLWQRLSASSSKEGYWANLELAKHFEHRAKDFSAAVRYARMAADISPYGDSHTSALQRRLERLASKMSRR